MSDTPGAKHVSGWIERAAVAAVLSCCGVLAGWSAASAQGITAGAAQVGPLCGRVGDVSQLLLDLQKPSVERLWRDTKIFILRDHDDGSLWAFSIKKSTVHPAVRCRRAIPGDTAPRFEVGQICPSGEAACASFAAQSDEKFDGVGSAGGPSR